MAAQLLSLRASDHLHCGQGGRRQSGRWCRRINQGPRGINHHIRPGAGTGHIAAAQSGSLAESSHLEIYPGGNSQLLPQSGPVFSQYAKSMRFIHQQQGAEFILQSHHLPEGGPVPVHAEDGFRHHQNSAGRVRLPQALQLLPQ